MERMCYSHYGKMIKSARKGNSTDNVEDTGQDEENDEESLDYDDDFTEELDPEEKFHYIITEMDELGEEIPNFMKLKNPFPKENPILQKRIRPAAIRFHKPNRDNNPHKYFLSELMLFIPFRD